MRLLAIFFLPFSAAVLLTATTLWTWQHVPAPTAIAGLTGLLRPVTWRGAAALARRGPVPTPKQAVTAVQVAPTSTLGAVPGTPARPGTPAAYQAKTRIERLMQRMTLDEKIGQLMLVGFAGPAPTGEALRLIAEGRVGGIILAQDNLVQQPQQVRALTLALQRAAAAGGGGIPLFVAVDQEGGTVVRAVAGITLFPGNMALGATASESLARQAAEVVARELRALGINVNLAPVVDVVSNPYNSVIGTRSFGSDPALVSRLGAAAIRGYQATGVLAIAKHFPGHGNPTLDSHLGLPVLRQPRDRLEAVEFAPFRAAVGAGVGGVMLAHLVAPALDPDPGRPASLSSVQIGLLRDMLGSDGLIVTDDLEMQAIQQRYRPSRAAQLAFQAGADVLLIQRNVGEQWQAHSELRTAVVSGQISRSRLDASVRRVLQAKALLGLLGSPTEDAAPGPAPTAVPATDLKSVGAASHQAVAAAVARQAVTVVRDERKLLPLTPGTLASTGRQRICAVLPAPQALARLEPLADPLDRPRTLGEAIGSYQALTEQVAVSWQPTPGEQQRALACARRATVLILGTYDLHVHRSLRALAQRLVATGTPTVVVALHLPHDLLFIPDVSTYVASYSARPVALAAAADVLFGAIKPSGRLPVPLGSLYPLGSGLGGTGAKVR